MTEDAFSPEFKKAQDKLEIIGRYKIIRRLGQGALGVVIDARGLVPSSPVETRRIIQFNQFNRRNAGDLALQA